MSKIINWCFDALVIVIQISMGMTIIPYIIYGNVEPFILVHLINALASVVILFIRFKGKIYSVRRLFNFLPIKIFSFLLLAQLISGLIKMEESYILAPLIFSFNFLVFMIYLNNLYYTNINKFKNLSLNQVFLKSLNIYLVFAVLNVILVLLSAGLQLIGFIAPYSNSINDLYPQLLSSNVKFGGAFYYMPANLSIQTDDSRLGFDFGTLMGLTHEPHVFTYLVFPSLFFLLAKYCNNKKYSYFISAIYVAAGLISFSVTTVIVLSVVVLVKLISEKQIVKVVVTFAIILMLSATEFKSEILSSVFEYSTMKLTSNTSSLDYSANKVENIIFPTSIFGDGVMLLGKQDEKNGGIFTSLLYIMFYGSILICIFKILKRNNKQDTLIALAFLYFFVHGLKLSSSVFAMPYTILLLSFMALYYKAKRSGDELININHLKAKKNIYESTSNN